MLARCRARKVPSRPEFAAVVDAVGRLPGGVVLESSLPATAYARWSILAFDPVTSVTVPAGFGGCPFAALAQHFARYPALETERGGPPFPGGWIGYLSYEAGLAAEGVRPIPSGECFALARFALYDTVLLLDGLWGDWYVVAVDWPEGERIDRPAASDRLARGAFILRLAAEAPPVAVPTAGCPARLTPALSCEQYLGHVERILDFIAAGDVYQVNLTQRFRTKTPRSPLELYHRLRTLSPSSHAALLAYDDCALLSSSPELFLRTRGRRIATRPIKGTRPRSSDPALDRRLRDDLASAEKDAAELAMIVDLVRNDLGRVCEYGSVRVTDPASVEGYPTVFHRVATVTGRLRDESGFVDVLRATFPGGSVTGAPKIRAMQIISELEATPRAAYCGAIGWVGLNGCICLNLAIRTMIQRNAVVDLYAGGGIVADSVPENEYDEVMSKLTGMAAAVGCPLPLRDQEHLLAGAHTP